MRSHVFIATFEAYLVWCQHQALALLTLTDEASLPRSNPVEPAIRSPAVVAMVARKRNAGGGQGL